MNIINIIDKKRLNQSLTKEELEFAVNGFIEKTVADYQMSALLMAITINGMNEEEVFHLVDIMLNSGDIIDLSDIKKTVIDKHSTGGVGDKTTLVVGPIVAACNLAVAKMSGRGLGHTGGTIDKLESIEGFKVEISNEEFVKQVNEVGFALVSQKGNLVPADKKIYALRDVTGTTSSIPLIAASIMSKKLASGADYIVLDVKVGNGAFFEKKEDARQLAELMKKIGEKYNKKTICVISNMNEPLGRNIGNGLEIKECIDFFNNLYDESFYELVVTLASQMVAIGKNIELNNAIKEVEEVIQNGTAKKVFEDFIKAQHGDINNVSIAEKKQNILSTKEGYITEINSHLLGTLVKDLGGGRNTKDDIIDYGVGFILNKKVGDKVNINEPLAIVYYNKKDISIHDILSVFKIEEKKEEKAPIIIDVV